MLVRVVVALDERRDEDPRVSQRPEPVGEHRGELEALEPALGIGVVITDTGPRVRRK